MKDFTTLIKSLMAVREQVLEGENLHRSTIENVHPNFRYSAKNFIRYLKLRTFDLREIQAQLSSLGLSSISHSERHVLANLENILHFLHLSQGKKFNGCHALGQHPVNFAESQKVLQENTRRLLKTFKDPNDTSIMVTLSTAAVDYRHVVELINAGMKTARINCSHDDKQVWLRMVKNIKLAVQETGRDCSIYFDLSGPKLRTGEIAGKKKKPFILLQKGDLLHLHAEQILGKPAQKDEAGDSIRPAEISCTIPEVLENVSIGDSVWFDDGKIGGKIVETAQGHVVVKITRANPKGGKLKAQKGINFPDTEIKLPSLTDDDLENLPFIVQHADIVGYSFVRKPSDVKLLQDELEKLNRPNLGIVLKIENKEAFNNLPALIIQGMKSPSLGVMTARGDLSVELGAERLSEVQEQILWLCEASLIPNIWATQVLESLAKKGIAARAEITDAAMSVRSECVMLNKGEYILEAVQTLGNILNRMKHHQFKKQGTLRRLQVADNYFSSQR